MRQTSAHFSLYARERSNGHWRGSVDSSRARGARFGALSNNGTTPPNAEMSMRCFMADAAVRRKTAGPRSIEHDSQVMNDVQWRDQLVATGHKAQEVFDRTL